MFESKNKTDLMIEVWEKLDCESVGREEILAIQTVVRDVYGEMAVDGPMTIARLLADEGADLRHSEVMELHIERVEARPPDAALLNLFDLSSLDSLGTSLKNAENLRKILASKNNDSELRALRAKAIDVKKMAAEKAEDPRHDELTRKRFAESVQWITLWLQSPELFENWVKLRKGSPDFRKVFLDTQ
jgi:hypothetical protein